MVFFLPFQIKGLRQRYKINQIELAEASGLSQSMIARIESGSVDPRFSTIERISSAIDVLAKKKTRTISEIMNFPVVFVSPKEKVRKAVLLMKKRGYSQIPIVKDGNCVGCVTEKGILKLILAGKCLKTFCDDPVMSVASETLPTIDICSDPNIVYSVLKNSPAVLIVSKGVIKGIIARADILK